MTISTTHMPPPRPRILLVICFLFILLVPGILYFFPTSVPRSRLPSPNLKTLESYPIQLRDFIQIQFPLRHELVKLHAFLRIKFLRSSPTKKVILGKQGWLFFADDGSLSSHRHTAPLTEEELKAWINLLDRRHRMCQEVGATYYTLIIPDKHTIYPEYLPSGFGVGKGMSRLTQLIEYARIHAPHLNIPDLRPDLRDAKLTCEIYQKSDTHWNDYGAYIAYKHLFTALTSVDPRFKPLGLEHFTPQTINRANTDLTDVLEAQQLYPNLYAQLIPKVTLPPIVSLDRFTKLATFPDASLPRLVMFYDSFGEHLIPFFQQHFSRFVMRNALFFNYVDIENEHPKVVIGEFVERALSRPIQVDNNRVQ